MATDHCELAGPWPESWGPGYYPVNLLQPGTELLFSHAALSTQRTIFGQIRLAPLWLDFSDNSTVRLGTFNWN